MLAAAVDAYVAVRRAAGFTFRSEARQLASFAAFSEARTESRVRASLAIEWAGLARSMSQRARRLGHVIRLARYLRAHRRWGADFLIRMVDGHVDGAANARGWRMRGTEARP